MNVRSLFWLVALVAATALAGAYLSGYLVLRLLQLDGVGLKWDTWWSYARALHLPQVQPYAMRIQAAGWLGIGTPLLAAAGMAVLVLRSPRRSTHGDARFASSAELARKGLFKDSGSGIVIGRHRGRLLRLNGQQFAILAAPTRSGKGVGIVIPNLLDYRDSMVVLDIKQENFALTSGWRAAQGQQVFLFNPFAEDRRSHRWNPLGYVSGDPALRISDLQAIAATLYPDTTDEHRFWVSQARNAFLAFALYLFDSHDQLLREGAPPALLHPPTLGRLYRLSSGDGGDLRAYLRGLCERDFLQPQARTAFSNLLSQAEETLASIMGTLREPLNAWINPVLDAATSANDFHFDELRRTPMTIYVGIQPNKLAEARLIVNLFFSQLINVNTTRLPQTDPGLKHQCLLLMDEFTAVGKLTILANAVAYMAGYNLRLLPIIQSMAQLDAVYGKEVARTLITNHALQILYAPREQQDANDYSEMLGYTTTRRQNVTRGRAVSRNTVEERRALMLPQELKALGDTQQVFLYEGIPHPVRCDKIRYYQDRYFTRRLLPPVLVPQLSL